MSALLEKLMFPTWCWVVRSDRTPVCVPPTPWLERWLSYWLRQCSEIAAARLWATLSFRGGPAQ